MPRQGLEGIVSLKGAWWGSDTWIDYSPAPPLAAVVAVDRHGHATKIADAPDSLSRGAVERLTPGGEDQTANDIVGNTLVDESDNPTTVSDLWTLSLDDKVPPDNVLMLPIPHAGSADAGGAQSSDHRRDPRSREHGHLHVAGTGAGQPAETPVDPAPARRHATV